MIEDTVISFKNVIFEGIMDRFECTDETILDEDILKVYRRSETKDADNKSKSKSFVSTREVYTLNEMIKESSKFMEDTIFEIKNSEQVNSSFKYAHLKVKQISGS